MQYSRLANAAALLALTAFALAYGDHSPAPKPASAPATEFSAERAMSHLREIAQRPHPSGSPDHARVRNYLMLQLQGLGIPSQIQEATGVGTRYAEAGRVRNVVARIPGKGTHTGDAQAVLLMSHYDGVGAGPSAADAGSGVAALLETARALKADTASGGGLPRDVILLFTDGEESGLHGAEAFATLHPWARDVGMILNFEARGVHGASRMFETGRGNLDVVRVLRRVPGARTTSLAVTVYRRLPNDTDLSEMVALDRPMMNFAFIGGVQRYHTAQDDTTHLSRRSLQHHGTYALTLAREFAREPLLRASSAGDAEFFDVPLLGVVYYPLGWALPFAILAALLCVAAIVLHVRRSPRSGFVGIGVWRRLWLVPASMGLALLLCMLIAYAIGRVHANASIGGAPQWSALYTAALALVCVAVVTGAWSLAGDAGDEIESRLASLAMIAAIDLIVAFNVPGVGYLFTWPLMVSAIAALARVFATSPARARIALAAQWVAVAVTLIFFAPTVYAMVAVALGLDVLGAGVLAMLATTALWLVVPAFGDAGGTSRRVPAVAGAAAVVLLALGLARVRTNERSPAGVSYVYAVDADSLTSWLTGTATTPAARSWLQFALARTEGTPQPPSWLVRAYDARRIRAVGTAAVAPPTVTLLADSTTAAGRVVTLNIRGDSGTLSIGMSADSGAILAASVDGRPVDRSRYRRRSPRWTLDYIAPPDSGFVLRLTLGQGVQPTLGVTARRAGIPALTGYREPSRPAWLIPYQSGDMTIVYRRIRL